MELFSQGGLVATRAEQVIFTSTTEPVLDKLGKPSGFVKYTFKQVKQADARKELKLEGVVNREKWEEQKRAAQELAARQAIAFLVAHQGELGLSRFTRKGGKNGTTTTLSFKDLLKPTNYSLAQIAATWGISEKEALDKLTLAGLRPIETVIEGNLPGSPAPQVTEGAASEEAREAANTEEQIARNEANEQARKDNPKGSKK